MTPDSTVVNVAAWLLARALLVFQADCNWVQALLVGCGATLAWKRPQTGARLFGRLRAAGRSIARHPKLAHLTLWFIALGLRLTMLPAFGVPDPYVPDEFSHLFLADTLLKGRLSNPVHPLWVHFETIHIFHQPTYSSMYFPGQALALAAGKLIAGSPWAGVLASAGLMISALYWMLRGWVPPRWAYFGAIIASLQLGITSYWVNSYWGGCLPAAGGALVIGAYPRLRNRDSVFAAALMGCGLALLMLTRPYEGLVFSSAIGAVLAVHLSRTRGVAAWRRLAPAVVLPPLVAGAFLLVYCRQVTGSAFIPPYAVNRRIYGWPGTLPWWTPEPAAYRHRELRVYFDWEAAEHEQIASALAILRDKGLRLPRLWRFYFGISLTLPLFWLPWTLRERRTRVALAAAALTSLAVITAQSAYPHYLAPAAACFVLLAVQGCRHMAAAGRMRRSRFATAMLPWLAVSLLAIAAVRGFGPVTRSSAAAGFGSRGCCRVQPGPLRNETIRMLMRKGGSHLVFVRYNHGAYNIREWVYNAPDIDAATIVWARDMGPAANDEVLRCYPTRQVWIVEPDAEPVRLRKYAEAAVR